MALFCVSPARLHSLDRASAQCRQPHVAAAVALRDVAHVTLQRSCTPALQLPRAPASRGLCALRRTATRSAARSASVAAECAEAATPLFLRACMLFTNLFPLWIVLGACLGLTHPPAVTWFKARSRLAARQARLALHADAPGANNGSQGSMITWALALTMLGMGAQAQAQPQAQAPAHGVNAPDAI